MNGRVINGYLRLYCLIKGIELPPKRCRDCGGELDVKYKARKAGYLCYQCYAARHRLSGEPLSIV